MVEVTLNVLQFEYGRGMRDLKTVTLLVVPRIGNIVITEGAEFEVRRDTDTRAVIISPLFNRAQQVSRVAPYSGATLF